MKPAAFRYHAPKTVDEAVAILAEVAGEDGRVLAGGQSLVPTMAFRLAKPAHLVDINGVAALNRLAGCRRQAHHRRRRAPFRVSPAGLRRAARRIARPTWCDTSRIIRSATAAPFAARWRMPIRRRNGAWCWWRSTARCLAKSARGERVIAARDFFKGIMTTALADDELLVEARLPMLRRRRALRL